MNFKAPKAYWEIGGTGITSGTGEGAGVGLGLTASFLTTTLVFGFSDPIFLDFTTDFGFSFSGGIGFGFFTTVVTEFAN